jgi:neutral ceramidase
MSCLAACLLTLASLHTGPADDAVWKAGIATVKITPEEPLQMAGYASRTKPFEKVNDDLYAKALALEDAQGHRAVIVTTDLIGFSAQIAEPICREISDKTGLKRADILLTAIHTHSAPTLSLDPNVREGFQAEDAKRTAAYTRALQARVAEVAVRALGAMEPARLSMGTGVAHFAMNRREFTSRGVILGVNPRGPVDRSVPVLRIDGRDGKLRGVLFSYACHNTTLGDKNMLLSGDYGGYAQRAVEEQNPGATALMMLGCAGDANPYPRGTMEMARDHGNALGSEVGRVLREKLTPVQGPLTTALERVPLPLADPPSHTDLEKIAATGPSYQQGVARGILALLDKGEKPPTHYTAPVAVWQFGDSFTLVALSGEVVVDYVASLEKALGPLNLWVVAYTNEVFGYLPSARVLEEGGYETRGIYAGGPGFFAPAAQEVLVKAVREMAGRAGRKLP